MIQEGLRTPENPFKPNQPVLTLGADYTLAYKYVVSDQKGQAIVHSEQVPTKDSAQWLEAYKRHAASEVGHEVMFRISDNISDGKDPRFAQTEKLNSAELRLLNPSQDDLKAFAGKIYERYTQVSEAGAEVDPNFLLKVGRSVSAMDKGTLPLDGYNAIDRECRTLLTAEMKKNQLSVESTAAGYAFAIDCLKVIDQALETEKQLIDAEIQRLFTEVRQLDAVKSVTPFEKLKRIQVNAALEATQNNQAKLLEPLRATRNKVLTVVGRLAVAADWYHTSNSATPAK